jgi:hypothetical protein
MGIAGTYALFGMADPEKKDSLRSRDFPVYTKILSGKGLNLPL